ncbi:hypothetical protein GCM10027321_35640 [Massilia terrae]|uniref:Uncharacterized protein n=1 Tax=Massilia terrae TaxID=1811224 RepID=A0ABT2D441_9BURK|nr:hypothetical protein [Massilia terrae]MCS0661002.1 hypothetical protein [Massilia terrae]
MNTNKLMLAALLACTLGPALAAEDDQAKPQREVIVQGPAQLRTADGKMTVNTTSMLRIHGRAVKNAPYSAQEVVERQQVLPDGNQIVNTTTTMSYRDSEGRLRVERRDRKGEVSSIMITDPVANVAWSLRPQDKTALKLKSVDPARIAAEAARAGAEAGRAAAEAGRAAARAGRAAAEAARAQAEQMRKDGDGREIIVKRVERDNGEAMQRVQENVRIVTREMTDDRIRALSSLEPMLANVAGDFKWSGKSTSKDLGTRDMGGVKAQGKLRSYEIPAGEIGNRNPITVSDESWWSPELQITLYSKHSDPRTGDNIYRLENLKREEPAAALFTVPSDYTIKEPNTPQVAAKVAPKSN